MFFTHLARIVALLVLLMGIAQIVMGFTIASGSEELRANLHRYTTAETTGELIDRGIYRFVFAIALGTLAEISLALRRAGKVSPPG